MERHAWRNPTVRSKETFPCLTVTFKIFSNSNSAKGGFVVVRTYDSHQSSLLWPAEQGDQIKSVLVAEATTAVVDDKGGTWQLLSDSFFLFFFLLFACCCFLRYWRLVVLTTELYRQLLSRCWFSLLMCVFRWMKRLISVVILAERRQISMDTNLISDQPYWWRFKECQMD